jgi:predicted nucleic acid-binding protein
VDSANNTIVISRLTPVELISAFAIKVRTKSIAQQEPYLSLRRFRSDIAIGTLKVFSITHSEFASAEILVERYAFNSRLRALDALQLAVALALRKSQFVDHFVAADEALCHVAELEGLQVLNPAKP